MDSKETHALSVAEAKERLRTVAGEMGPAAWTRNHPLESVIVAAFLGYLVESDTSTRSSLKESIRFFLRLI